MDTSTFTQTITGDLILKKNWLIFPDSKIFKLICELFISNFSSDAVCVFDEDSWDLSKNE